jgi:hypothetical protein
MAPRPTTIKKTAVTPAASTAAASAPKDIAQVVGSDRRSDRRDTTVNRPQIQQVRTRGMRLLFSPIEKTTPEGLPLQNLLGGSY